MFKAAAMIFQSALDEAFPASSDASVIRAVSEGIMLGDKTLDSEVFLKSLVGQDLRGHIRRAGILYRLHSMAQAGDLPFDSSMVQMPRGSWHWVELRSKNFTAHLCRSEGPEAFPTDTPTRQDDRLSNQFDLFADSPSVVPIGGYMAWLTFGASSGGGVGHLCWGMPSANEDAWLARTNLLRRASESDTVVKTETPPTATILKFRDHVEESLKGKYKDHGDKPA